MDTANISTFKRDGVHKGIADSFLNILVGFKACHIRSTNFQISSNVADNDVRSWHWKQVCRTRGTFFRHEFAEFVVFLAIVGCHLKSRDSYKPVDWSIKPVAIAEPVAQLPISWQTSNKYPLTTGNTPATRNKKFHMSNSRQQAGNSYLDCYACPQIRNMLVNKLLRNLQCCRRVAAVLLLVCGLKNRDIWIFWQLWNPWTLPCIRAENPSQLGLFIDAVWCNSSYYGFSVMRIYRRFELSTKFVNCEALGVLRSPYDGRTICM